MPDNSKKIILDLYCKAGGCTRGYQRAGFYVVGVDIEPQPHYCGDSFVQADALDIMDTLVSGQPMKIRSMLIKSEVINDSQGHNLYLKDIAAFHASPPCQFGSMATQQWRAAGREYPNLIAPTREGLIKTGKPYVIENVVGEPYLKNPIKLNGAMFQMLIRRTRYFETSFRMDLVLIPPEQPSHFRMGRPVTESSIITPVGHFSGCAIAKKRMGIDWMNQGELAQAIPPVYTEFIGKYLMQEVLRLAGTSKNQWE